MKLTKKQEAFVVKVFECDNQYESYLYAYPTSRTWTRAAVDVEANKLMKNPKIILRLKELRSKIEAKTEITLAKIVKAIYNISLDAEANGDRLKANDMLMKHLGGYAPEKIEHSGQTVHRVINVHPTKEKK